MLALSIASRKVFEDYMSEVQIEVSGHYPPLQRSPFAISSGLKGINECLNTDFVAQNLLRLPIYPEMTRGEIQRVCQALEKVAEIM